MKKCKYCGERLLWKSNHVTRKHAKELGQGHGSKKWNLSDKSGNGMDISANPSDFFYIDDVKEFIKRLKDSFGNSILTNKPYHYSSEMIYKEIDKLAGEKLI